MEQTLDETAGYYALLMRNGNERYTYCMSFGGVTQPPVSGEIITAVYGVLENDFLGDVDKLRERMPEDSPGFVWRDVLSWMSSLLGTKPSQCFVFPRTAAKILGRDEE